MVNAKKIAELANVSRSTVQRALSDHPNVAPETREKIQNIAKELGYIPNKTAKALVMRQQRLKYAVIFPSKENPFYLEVLKGVDKAKEELREYGVQVDMHFQHELEAREQVVLINKLVKENYEGIVCIPIDTEEVREAINRGVKKGTQFVTMISAAHKTRRLSFVGQDNIRSGLVAGGLMAYLVDKGEKIACFTGSKDFLAHKKRIDGFRQRFSESNPVESIVTLLENKDNSKISEELTENLLAEHPDLKGIFVAGAGVEGICRILDNRDLGKAIKLICFDLTEDHIMYCKKGIIDFIIDQEPFQEGYRALHVLNDYIMFDEVPDAVIHSKIDIRTAENADL